MSDQTNFHLLVCFTFDQRYRCFLTTVTTLARVMLLSSLSVPKNGNVSLQVYPSLESHSFQTVSCHMPIFIKTLGGGKSNQSSGKTITLDVGPESSICTIFVIFILRQFQTDQSDVTSGFEVPHSG